MNNNNKLIEQFYSAFQLLDSEAMNACYSEDIVFFDPIFGLLKGEEVKYMWEMLCNSAKAFSLEYNNVVELDDEYCTIDWTATYIFSKTNRKIVNRAKANMRFSGNKIIEHSDAFSLHQWSKQAFGISGVLFGWNSFFQNRIKYMAKKKLLLYIETKEKHF